MCVIPSKSGCWQKCIDIIYMSSNSGASDYANSVYGGIDQQSSAPGQGNLIQMNNPSGGLTGGNGSVLPHTVGGRRRRKKGRKGSRRGGVGLGGLLVPAGLVLANNYTYNQLRGKKGRKSARRSRGRAFRPFSRYMRGGSSPTGYSPTSTLSHASISGGNAMGPLKMGGNEPLKMGGTTLVDIAIPAGFVYANDRYFNRKNHGTTNKRSSRRRGNRRSRRGRR